MSKKNWADDYVVIYNPVNNKLGLVWGETWRRFPDFIGGPWIYIGNL